MQAVWNRSFVKQNGKRIVMGYCQIKRVNGNGKEI